MMAPFSIGHRWPLWMAISFALVFATATTTKAASPDSLYEWFSIGIEVSGLPADSPPVPVSCTLDFSALLERSNVKGAVDERSLRLSRVSADRGEVDEPVQFRADEQPRAKVRQFLPGTVPNVSYITEYSAGETPDVLRMQGVLTWMARGESGQTQRYRLVFGVPRRGRAIQVPYAPHDLRMFDENGRATPLASFSQMQIRPQWPLLGSLHITDRGALVTAYHVGPAWDDSGMDLSPIRRPFWYPVNGPNGLSLTELGKPHDPTGSHRHHDSLWIAHANVAGHDFWSDKGGVIAHREIKLLEDGPVYCRIVVRTRWRDGGTDCLDEQRSLTVYRSGGDFRAMDFDLEFQPVGAEPVELGKTSFGFLAVRVAQSMTPFDGGGEILNAKGQRNEQNAHLQHAAWIDQSGPVAPGAWGGIAMLDHPQNPNHPTVWHCRNDGWAGASFNAEQACSITKGKPLRLRYRVILHAGNATRAAIDRHWKAYAAEPHVQMGEPARESEKTQAPSTAR